MEENDILGSSASNPQLDQQARDDSKVGEVVSPEKPVTKARPRRIIRRRRRTTEEEIPAVDPVLLQKVLEASSLPKAYMFEIEKTVRRIKNLETKHLALQMPEGLLMYATVLADIFKRLSSSLEEVSVLGDVTYGACCVDDLGAQALGADLLVHYGHSCLVPLQHTVIPCLYVFVEIQLSISHMVECLVATIQADMGSEAKPFIYLLGTIQFRHAFATAKTLLEDRGYDKVSIPQAKPLSPGEVLGCTSPKLTEHASNSKSLVCFVADGRFHLESTLISNPDVPAYRYDPYGQIMTKETYDHDQMKSIRKAAISKAATPNATTFGIILGTLGRQGNPAIVHRIRQALHQHSKKHFLMLLSEITPAKLHLFGDKVDVWVQVACPRLSVDWGHYLSNKPVLSPYELFCTLGQAEFADVYPMDFYSQAGGPWSNYYQANKDRKITA